MEIENVICPNCKAERKIKRKPGNKGKSFRCTQCKKRVMPYKDKEEVIIHEKMIAPEKLKTETKNIDYKTELVIGSIWSPRGWKTQYKITEIDENLVTIEKFPTRGWVEDTRIFDKVNFLRHYVLSNINGGEKK